MAFSANDNEQADGVWTIGAAKVHDDETGGTQHYIVRVRQAVPPGLEPRQYPYLIEISWMYLALDGGMPSDEEADRMDEMEGLLELAFEAQGDAVLLTTITGNGKRIWMFYAKNIDLAERQLNDALGGQTHYPIEINVLMDPGWAHYHQIRQNARSDHDR